MDFTQILLISYLALFKWSSNYLSDNYFFLFDKIKQKSYYTILILSFIHSSTLSLLIFTASAILSTGNPISARESAVSLAFFNSPSATPASYSALRSFCSSSSLLYSKILRQSPPHDLLSEFFPK